MLLGPTIRLGGKFPVQCLLNGSDGGRLDSEDVLVVVAWQEVMQEKAPSTRNHVEPDVRVRWAQRRTYAPTLLAVDIHEAEVSGWRGAQIGGQGPFDFHLLHIQNQMTQLCHGLPSLYLNTQKNSSRCLLVFGLYAAAGQWWCKINFMTDCRAGFQDLLENSKTMQVEKSNDRITIKHASTFFPTFFQKERKKRQTDRQIKQRNISEVI